MGREKKKKKKFLSCINGVKGAISLFMAVLMTPFLTIAVILVETGRYNSAVSALDEALGVTSVSTLANYDDYLQERWGLLGISQDVDLDSLYAGYLDTNSGVMGPTLDVDKVTAEGMYALSDLQILEAQLMEYCKLNVPTTLGKEIVSKVSGLFDFIDKLKKGMSSINNFSSLLTKGVSTLDSGITMAESVETLKSTAEELDQLKIDYDDNYKTFKTAMNTLIDNLVKLKDLNNEIVSLEAQKAPYQEGNKRLDREISELEKEIEEIENQEPKTEEEEEKQKKRYRRLTRKDRWERRRERG